MKELILKIIYKYLALLSRIYVSRTKPFVVWITGSVWKTSCRMIITQVMQKYLKWQKIYTSPKNFNSELGLVFSIFQVEEYKASIKNLLILTLNITKQALFWEKKYDVLVLEYWVDHPGDMDFLLSVVKPDLAIFTKLDYIHAANFPGGINQIWEEKFKLIAAAKKKVYLNYLDKFLQSKFDWLKWEKDYFWNLNYSLNYIKEWDNIYSSLDFGVQKIKTNSLWDENMIYIELAYRILADIFDIQFEDEEYIELTNQPGRFSIFKWINDSVLIDSTYNAWPESMKKMIQNTIKLRDKVYSDYKIWFVIWDMRELWEVSLDEHKKLFEELSSADLLLSIWEQTKWAFPKNIKNFTYSRDAGIYLKEFLENSTDKYLILFKWSQNTIFSEEALKQVLGNKDDREKLVRQDFVWIEKKRDYM
jgi:UDP-N-acetylmuramoyl-tripeptide--D-alanyl-D-alanine ligase